MGRLAGYFAFDGVEFLDPQKRFFGDRRLALLEGLEEVASRMRHARDMDDLRGRAILRRTHFFVGRIGVRLQIAGKVGEIFFRPLALAIGRVAVKRRRWL